MKGDFSRIPFDPLKHYSGVLHQQGRVWLDSDWNEDIFERLNTAQGEIRDIVGFCGVPSPGAALVLSASTTPNAPDDFQISGGRFYVDGMPCVIEGSNSYHTQPDLPDAPAIPIPATGSLTAVVYVEVWRRLITYLEDPSIREIALGGPDTSTRLKTVAQIRVAVWPNPPSTPTCALAAGIIPAAGQGTLTTLQPAPQAQAQCQLPDPANYTGRENRLYRVQIHDGGDPGGGGSSFQIALAANAAAGSASLTLATALTAAQAGAAARSGFVTVADNSGASERVPLTSASGTVIQLGQALQQAHTMANAATVTGGVAQFKWSRDNASFAISVVSVAADRITLTLASLGRDVATSLKQGDLVEISDDASELGPARGHLTYVNSIPDPDTFTVALLNPLPAAFVLTNGQSSRHMVLRRWDGTDSANFEGGQNNLGDGVSIQFGGAVLQPGDYWQFATRSADGSVQPLLNAPPAGDRRSRAAVAIVTWGPPPATSPPSSPPAGPAMTVVDCRNVFPPLIGFPQADKVVRITGVTLVAPGAGPASALVNDSNIQITAFGGIDVQCDTPIDPASISRPTCFVSIEYPIDFGPQPGAATAYLVAKLAGAVKAAGSVISWRPLTQTQSELSTLIIANLSERGILARLVLKGNFIWSLSDPTVFLDGEVFGSHNSGANNLSLILPSGDKRRGGDFETWFWLVAAPAIATAITPSSVQIYGGGQATFSVSFSTPASTAGTMTLTVTPANIVSVPASVAVAVGASSAVFTATSAGVAAAPPTGTVSITAAFGGQSVVATLTVAPPPVLTGQLQLSAASIQIGAAAVGTVTLNGPAPPTGSVVTLTTSNAAVATVTASITIPASATSGTFTITGVAAGTATIAASLGGTSVSALITVFQKGKDTKETKDVKDGKETKDGKESKESLVEKTHEVLQQVKVRTLPVSKIADSATPLGIDVSGGGAASEPVRAARSFIRPEERPPVEKSVLNAARVQ
jgi:hypothetical protein